MRRVALALACTACGPSAYACIDHGECRSGDVVGMCQPDGRCSFPDDTCASGQRYGEHGGAQAGQCVPPTDDTEGAAATSSDTATGTTSTTTADAASTSTSAPGTTAPSTSSTSDADTTDTTTDTPPPTEPLLWFTFDDMSVDAIANAGSLGGTAACDVQTCPAIVEGVVGTAARFDGIDDCAIFPHAPELGGLGALTIAAWLQREVIEPEFAYDCLLCKPVGVDPWNTWRLATYDHSDAGPVVDFRVGLASNGGTSVAGGMPLGEWVHAVAVWDGAQMVLWIDGEVAVSYENDLYEDDGQAVFLGCDDDHGELGLWNFLTGAIDEVRFYDRAIADDEIAALFAAGR